MGNNELTILAHKTEEVNRVKTVRFYPIVFTGMERDEEKERSRGPFASERGDEPRSGIPYCSVYSYTYFGARYMDHELMTMWLSVDPMADKYPGISPYAYCAWNPVKLVDPDGKEIVNDWVRRADGTIYWDPNAKSPASTKKGETYLGKKGATYDRQTNEVTLYRENGTTSKFQSSGPMTDGNYTYPIDIKSDTYNNSRSNPSALYGSRRGERKHAGCDLYAPEGTAVFSITKGTVMSVGRFYKGTDEIAINHNSFIGRYCELIPSFDIKPGCKVNSGDFLGVIVSMPIKNGGNNSMLHFEMYLGNASGKLTNRNNPPFERRSDLKNPTMVLNNLIAKTWSF